MRGWLTACALWVPMLAVVAARADSPELRACANDAALPQLRVEACTALMHAGAAVGVDAAWLLLQRGEAYADLGELDFALAHFDAARRLRPGDPKILERHAAASIKANAVPLSQRNEAAVKCTPAMSEIQVGNVSPHQYSSAACAT